MIGFMIESKNFRPKGYEKDKSIENLASRLDFEGESITLSFRDESLTEENPYDITLVLLMRGIHYRSLRDEDHVSKEKFAVFLDEWLRYNSEHLPERFFGSKGDFTHLVPRKLSELWDRRKLVSMPHNVYLDQVVGSEDAYELVRNISFFPYSESTSIRTRDDPHHFTRLVRYWHQRNN